MRRSGNRLWAWAPALLVAGAAVCALSLSRQVAVAGAESSPPTTQPAGGVKEDPNRAKLSRGWDLIRVANWVPALDILEQVAKDASDRQIRAQATYAVGYIWQHRGAGADRDKAAVHYRRITGEFSDTKMTPWAALALARMAAVPKQEPKKEQGRRKLREDARKTYREIIKTYRGHMVADESTVWLATTYLTQMEDDKATKAGAGVLLDYLKIRPDNYLAATMHYLLAKYYQDRAEYREAIEHLIASDAAGLPSEKTRAAVYFRVARIAERKLKDYALAAKWYHRIVTHARRDERFYVAKLAAERCRKLAAGLPAVKESDQ